ncbi:MAG: glutathione peroxidase [Spirochaetaceae bacterium]|jgi:glutathione peroxidase|nr:glutathione peroxidase [Spirochaetaceae bacterium]
MSIYDFTVKNDKGVDVSLDDYRGKVLLVVNTATGCGLTPQYEGLEKLYEEYKDRGFEILDFPCNQFAGQAPGTIDEINSFCTLKYHTSFPRFAKIDVNGDTAEPLWVWLKKEIPAEKTDLKAKALIAATKKISSAKLESDIKWNFCKFLIDKEGNAVERFTPTVEPKNIAQSIEALL